MESRRGDEDEGPDTVGEVLVEARGVERRTPSVLVRLGRTDVVTYTKYKITTVENER